MSKIYQLREWYDVKSAADRLSNTLSETISEQELIQLAIEEHIQLSWNIRCRYAHKISLYNGINEPGVDGKSPMFETFKGSAPQRINGIFHINFKRSSGLKDYLVSLNNGIPTDLVSFDGFCLTDDEGYLWQVLDNLDGVKNEKQHKQLFGLDGVSNNFCPSIEYPSFEELGFTKKNLEKFESSLTKYSKNNPNTALTKEKETLLKLVAIMAYDGYGYNPSEAKSPITKDITNAAEKLGIQIHADTVRKWLQEAAKAHPKPEQ